MLEIFEVQRKLVLVTDATRFSDRSQDIWVNTHTQLSYHSVLTRPLTLASNVHIAFSFAAERQRGYPVCRLYLEVGNPETLMFCADPGTLDKEYYTLSSCWRPRS
jgi:hypothetical protein